MNTFTYSDKLENATTIRAPVENFLNIDSNDRYVLSSGQLYQNAIIKNNSDFIISNSKTFGAGLFKRLGVTEVNFPMGNP